LNMLAETLARFECHGWSRLTSSQNSEELEPVMGNEKSRR